VPETVIKICSKENYELILVCCMLFFVYHMLSVCELSKEKPCAKWEIEADDGDTDFLCHTLFLKQVSVTAVDKILHQ